MSSNNCKSIDDITAGGGKLSVSEHSPVVDSFSISLSQENPFEKKLIGYLRGRMPVQVGRLRFAVGEELITELLLRGADSLEAEYPGALGLQEMLALDSRPERQQPDTDPESGEKPGQEVAGEKSNDTLNQAAPVIQTDSPPGKKSEENPKNSSPSGFMNSDDVPRLNLSGIDFGSNPVLADP